MINGRLFLGVVLLTFFVSAQEKDSDYRKLIYKAYLKLYQNPNECVDYSENQLINNLKTEEKVVLQDLVSQAYAMNGDFVRSVKLLVEEKSLPDNNTSSLTKVYLNYGLAKQFYNLELYEQSIQIIQEILNKNRVKSFDTNPNWQNIQAKTYQLKALNETALGKDTAAISSIQKSNSYLQGGQIFNKVIQVENDLFQALILTKTNQITEAKEIIRKKKELISGENLHYLESFQKMIEAEIAFTEQDFHKSIELLNDIEKQTTLYYYPPLKAEVYKLYSENYLALGNLNQYNDYNKTYYEIKTALDSNKKAGIRYLIKLVDALNNKEIKQKQQEGKVRTMWFLGAALLILLLSISIYIYEYKRKINLNKQIMFFENQKTYYENQNKKLPIIVTKKVKKTDNKSLLSKEKEIEIMKKLDEFEKTDKFLSKQMSLAVLAGKMEINTKYLSEAINVYKGKNFNQYINELRIKYIVNLLQTNPKYLNYKVSYLAEVAGFSSHSAFTTVFKSITGISPNKYIKEINQNNNQ